MTAAVSNRPDVRRAYKTVVAPEPIPWVQVYGSERGSGPNSRIADNLSTE